MAHIYRLVFLIALLFSVNANAVIPMKNGGTAWTSANITYCQTKQSSVFSGASSSPEGQAACNAIGSLSCDTATYSVYYAYAQCNLQGVGTLQTITVPGSCPENSVDAGGGMCKCSAGFREYEGQCVEDSACGFLKGKPVPGMPRMEADYGRQSPSWAAGMIGKQGLSCTPEECKASGTITGCVAGQGGQGSTVCYIADPKYTGAGCKKDEKPGGGEGCPAGTKPDPTNPAICQPFKTSCPEGSEPSKYVEDLCIPKPPDNQPKDCEDPKDPTKRVPCEAKPNDCPPGYVPSQYVKGVCIPAGDDGEGKDKDGNNTTCKDGKCTTTKPDGSKVDKPKTEFCKENPESELCKESPKGSFTGSCQVDFKCEGDAVMCAIAKEQHKRNCQIDKLIETDEYRLWQNSRDLSVSGAKVTDGIEGNTDHTIIINGGDDFIGGGSGLSDESINLGRFGTIVIPFSQLNYWLEIMGNVFVIICSIVGAMTIIRRH